MPELEGKQFIHAYKRKAGGRQPLKKVHKNLHGASRSVRQKDKSSNPTCFKWSSLLKKRN